MALMSEDEVIGLAKDLHSQHVSERNDLDVLRRYVTGKQRIPLVVPRDAPLEVREMARISRINLIAIVVRALVESLYVDNFRSTSADTAIAEDIPDPELDPEALQNEDPLARIWRAWQLNRFDRRQAGLYQAVYTYGYGYVTVTPGRLGGENIPVMRPVSPRRMIAMYDEDDDDFPVYTLERRRNVWRVMDSTGVYDLRKNGEQQWELAADPSEHGLDYCPVVRYTAIDDLDADDEPADETPQTLNNSELMTNIVAGEVAPLMTLQDQCDVTTFALKAAEWYTAFRQRWIVGWTPENREQKVKSGASQLWTFEEDPEAVRIGEFSQTDLDGYLRSRQETMKYGATLSQTPVHELIGELVNLSAEALAAAEAGRDRKVMLGKTSLGEGHEQLAQVIGDLMGLNIPEDLETVWRDTSARAFGAIVDALGKLAAQLQIPPQMLWDRIPGVTRQDVERWQQAAREGDALDRMTALLDQQAAGTDPGQPAPGETRTDSGLILPPGARV